MIGALKQLEAGRKAEDVAREAGVSKHTIYAWKAKYGGMDVNEAQEAKQLRDENVRLKKRVMDLIPDTARWFEELDQFNSEPFPPLGRQPVTPKRKIFQWTTCWMQTPASH